MHYDRPNDDNSQANDFTNLVNISRTINMLSLYLAHSFKYVSNLYRLILNFYFLYQNIILMKKYLETLSKVFPLCNKIFSYTFTNDQP